MPCILGQGHVRTRLRHVRIRTCKDMDDHDNHAPVLGQGHVRTRMRHVRGRTAAYMEKDM